MLELCPHCGEALRGDNHTCAVGHAGHELALDDPRPSHVASPRVERTAPPPASFAAPPAVEGASLVWRFTLTDGREVVAELDTRSRVETVRLAGRIVSRSGAGGNVAGHAFVASTSGLHGDPNAYRAGAAPGEALVRFDPAMRTCAFTVDGVPILPSALPAPPIAARADVGHYPSAQPEKQPFPILLVGVPIGTLTVILICFLIGKTGVGVLAGLGILVAVTGNILVLVAAFSESAAWGLACLFVPGASFVFAVSHWDRAKRGFGTWLLGLVLLFSAGLGMARLAPATSTTGTARKAPPTEAETKPVSCAPAEPPPSGFARWCCKSGGWAVTDAEGCASAMKPLAACDESNVGTSVIEGCATGGGRAPVRRRR